MPRPKRWTEADLASGIQRVTLASWKYFADFVNSNILDCPGYVFRGHRLASWRLEPTIDRLMRTIPSSRRGTSRVRKHLQAFKYSVRGKRGPNPPELKTENDWWALGQHNGLATPLLDWCESPYVALFFAFENINDPPADRAVWAVHWYDVEEKSKAIARRHRRRSRKRAPIVEFFRPMTDENQRLVNQSGLFTRAPHGVDVERWVRNAYKGEDEYIILFKIILPDEDREDCLTALNRMNINQSTLFPDLYGSAAFCNTKLTIAAY